MDSFNSDNNNQDFMQNTYNNPHQNPYQEPLVNGYESTYNTNGQMYQTYEEPEKPHFFMQFPYAFNPTKYGVLSNINTGAMIGFVALLLAICTLVTYIGFAISFNDTEAFNEVMDVFPYFKVDDGEFYIEEDFEYDDPNKEVYVYFSDDYDSFSLGDAEELHTEGYDSVMLISRTNLVLESDGEYNQLSFKDFGTISFDKDWIIDSLIPGLFVFVSVCFIFYYIARSFWYFFCAMIYMLIAMICAKIFHRDIAAGVLFKASVYAKVLMTVVACLLSVLPVAITIPAFIRTMITLAMIIAAFGYLPQRTNV